jgi:hypothetical protein
MVGPHHLPQVFRIELSGEHSRIYQVTEEDGELPPLGDGRTRPCGACQARRILHWRSSGRWRGLARDRRGDHGSTGEARPPQRPGRVILRLCGCSGRALLERGSRRCQALDCHNTHKAIAIAPTTLDQRLRPPTVAQGLPGQPHAAFERRLTDALPRPHVRPELVRGHDVIAMVKEVLEHMTDCGLEPDGRTRSV